MNAHVSPLRRVLGRSVSALRKLHQEQMAGWEALFRAGLPRR